LAPLAGEVTGSAGSTLSFHARQPQWENRMQDRDKLVVSMLGVVDSADDQCAQCGTGPSQCTLS
jgi:hypothetical protein